MGEPTAAAMPLPAPTQRTRSEHHFPALPIGRFRCCDLTVPVWQAFANGSSRPSAASDGRPVSGNLTERVISGCVGRLPHRVRVAFPPEVAVVTIQPRDFRDFHARHQSHRRAQVLAAQAERLTDDGTCTEMNHRMGNHQPMRWSPEGASSPSSSLCRA